MPSSTLAPDQTPANRTSAPTAPHTKQATGKHETPLCPCPEPAASPAPAAPMDLRRFDVVRYRHNGRVQTGTVVETRGERVWLKTGAATVDVALESVVALVQPSPAR